MKNSFIEIIPLIRGKWTVNLPSSKSIAIRALHLAALAKGTSEIRGDLKAYDISQMIECWSKLGVLFSKTDDSVKVHGISAKNISATSRIYLGQAGTVARFIAAFLMLAGKSSYLYGDKQMNSRPMFDLCSAMSSFCDISYGDKEGFLPFNILPPKKTINTSDDINLNCQNSSQYLSGLLMAFSAFNHPVNIVVAGKLVSEPYVDMTIKIVKSFGGNINKDASTYRVYKTSGLLSKSLEVEPDLSSASYFLALAAIGGSEITFPKVSKNSIQGDIFFLKILADMGCGVEYLKDGVRVKGPSKLRCIDIDMVNHTDLVPALCVVALFSNGVSYIRNIAHMKYKESNRIKALINEIGRIGGKISLVDGEDICIAGGGQYVARVVKTYDDHRIAMALSIIGTKVSGLKIENPLCVNKSYPDFFKHLSEFGF